MAFTGTFAHAKEVSTDINLDVGRTAYFTFTQSWTGSIVFEEVGTGRCYFNVLATYTTNGAKSYTNNTHQPIKARLRCVSIDDNPGVETVDYTLASDAVSSSVIGLTGDGAPTSGASGTGAGFAGPGSRYTDTTGVGGNAVVYDQIGTIASPTWAPRQLGDSV